MPSPRRPTSRFVVFPLAWWCIGWVLLMALHPFIAVHFRDDGWEDEPGFRIRATGATVEFEPDARPDRDAARETTLFAPTGASIDSPETLRHGLDGLMALVLTVVPLLVAWCARALPIAVAPRARSRAVIRAPPDTAGWRRSPPKTAPPPTT